jgi:hypothetical protein
VLGTQCTDSQKPVTFADWAISLWDERIATLPTEKTREIVPLFKPASRTVERADA